MPRLSARQLQELLDQGTVREAAPGTFYVYRRTEGSDGAETAPSGWEDPAVQKRVISIAVWLLIALVPILYRSVSQMLR